MLPQTSPRFQTASSVMSFVVAALTRPEIQKMAQVELDAVTGRERLPTFEDRPRLPFVDAICKEVIRWRPVTPIGELLPSLHLTCIGVRRSTGLPHATTEDDVYEGFFIPKGLYSQHTNLFRCWLICIFRCDNSGKFMVRYLPYSFLLLLQPFVGRSFMTRPRTQNPTPSNQSGSSTQMELCLTIQC
jgi:hypothetical protein